jgi:hypothetical protein
MKPPKDGRTPSSAQPRVSAAVAARADEGVRPSKSENVFMPLLQ